MTDAFSNRRTEAVLGERDAIPSVVPSPLQRASLSIQYHRAPSVHPVSRFTARVARTSSSAPPRSRARVPRPRLARIMLRLAPTVRASSASSASARVPRRVPPRAARIARHASPRARVFVRRVAIPRGVQITPPRALSSDDDDARSSSEAIRSDAVDDAAPAPRASDAMVEPCDGDDGAGVVSGASKPNDSYAIEKRRANTTAIVGTGPVAQTPAVARDEPTKSTPARAESTTRPVLSEEELLPPSKREPRGKEYKEDGGDKEGGDAADGDGKGPSGSATKGGATTKTKPKTDGEKETVEKKLATPKSAPVVSGGAIRSAAGMAAESGADPVLAGVGGGDDGDDARSGGGGGGGGGDDKNDGDDEDEEEDDDDEVVLPDPWYKLAWEETEREIVRIMQRLLNIWITRDPSKTTRLVLFSVMGTGLFLASLLLYPENPLEFSDNGLFSSVFGRNPRWVINRELGPVQPTLLSTTCACAVAFAKVRLGANMFKLSPFMHGVLGLPMGFMLVFRWNNAHERWWYGRTCLGNILFYCKNLGGTFCTWVAPDDPILAARTLGLIGALKETVADRLNGTVLNDGAILSQLTTPLDAGDLEGLFLAENKVLYCLEKIRGCVQEAFNKGYVPPAIASTIHSEVAMIMDNYGSCEKVVNQPPPGCIITHLKSTLMVYVCSLPMILVHEVGVWGVVPVTTILSLALFGIEAAAEQIEQPFGNRPYDLPVRALMNSNSRDLEQTSEKVIGMTGFVNGVKMPFIPEGSTPSKEAMSAKTLPQTLKTSEPPTPPPPPPAAFVTPAPSAAALKAAAAPPISESSVVIPTARKDNTVSFSSDRLDAASVAALSKESPFAFTSNEPATSSAEPAKQPQPPSPKVETRDGEGVPSRPSTPTAPMTPSRGKSALQAAMDAVSETANSRAPVNPSSYLSPLRTGRMSDASSLSSSAPASTTKGELPAWKAQSPIEIYDQVLDERPSSTIPDSPRYHTQNSLRRRDSYGQQFFDMFTQRPQANGASEPNSAKAGSNLQRSSSVGLPRSSSVSNLSGPSYRTNAEGERDIRDIPFSRNAFGRSPSRSDLISEEDGGVPMRRVGAVNRSTSVTDMSALEEAIKRAREARKRTSGGSGSP